MSASSLGKVSRYENFKPADIEPPLSTPFGLRSLVAGAVGGVCSVLVGHPFDLVKVRRQTAEKGVYSGSIDAIRKAVMKDGLVRVRGIGESPSRSCLDDWHKLGLLI